MNDLDAWTARVAQELGLPPVLAGRPVRDVVLDLTRDVAHGVARPAAPLTAFLVGVAAGREGATVEEVQRAVERVLTALPPVTTGDDDPAAAP